MGFELENFSSMGAADFPDVSSGDERKFFYATHRFFCTLLPASIMKNKSTCRASVFCCI